MILRPALVCLSTLAAGAAAAAQSTWYVDATAPPPGLGTRTEPYASLQYAIDQPTTLDGDTLLVLPGVYAENVDLHGKSLALKSSGGAAVTTLRGGAGSPTVALASGEAAGSRLEGFRITGGGSSGSPGGGGLRCVGVELLVRDCVFELCGTDAGACTTDFGGGLYADASQLTLVQCDLRSNAACVDGGGAWLRGSTVVLQDGELDSNRAETGSGGGFFAEQCTIQASGLHVVGNTALSEGGGFRALQSALTLTSSLVELNEATLGHGGGATARLGTTTLRDVVLDANIARNGGNGGGLAAIGGAIALVDCTFSGNLADADRRGGGAYVEYALGTCWRSTFDANRAADGGGAYALGSLEFVECTFHANVARSIQVGTGSGGGLHGGFASRSVFHANAAIAGPSASGLGGGVRFATLDHCVLYGNTADVSKGTDGSSFADCLVANSVSWGNVPATHEVADINVVTFSDTESGVLGLGNFSALPQFVDAAAGDFHLLAGSPCIDAGDPAGELDPDGSPPDVGAFPFGQALCGAKLVYCHPKTNSLGCVPKIAFNAEPPSVSAGLLVVSASNVLNQRFGLLIHGFAPSSAPFEGGTLCVLPPLVRTAVQSSGGSLIGSDCTGTYSFAWTSAYFASEGIGPGVEVFAQYWSRDPQSAGATGLTAAAQFLTCP